MVLYEKSLNFYDNFKRWGDILKYVLGLGLIFGVGPKACGKIYNKVVDKVLNEIEVHMAVDYAMDLSIRDLKAFGFIRIDGEKIKVEIRTNNVMVDSIQMVDHWAFVMGPYLDKYKAEFSAGDNSYYFWDSDNQKRIVEDIKYNKYYGF